MKHVVNSIPSFSATLQVNAAELASLVESASPVLERLVLIIATSDFGETPKPELQNLRDWVDHAYVALVELCELAADRVEAELEELGASSAPTHPQS